MNHPTLPTSPANAGAQIHPERFGCSRPRAALNLVALVASIWAPAFAGEIGWEKLGPAA